MITTAYRVIENQIESDDQRYRDSSSEMNILNVMA